MRTNHRELDRGLPMIQCISVGSIVQLLSILHFFKCTTTKLGKIGMMLDSCKAFKSFQTLIMRTTSKT